MSYCRWSSDDHTSDVYVYFAGDEHGGFVTEVAGRRYLLPDGLPPELDVMSTPTLLWLERHQERQRILKAAALVPIGLPHDGASFRDPTPRECAARLRCLAAVGYRVPADAIAALDQEAAEQRTQMQAALRQAVAAGEPGQPFPDEWASRLTQISSALLVRQIGDEEPPSHVAVTGARAVLGGVAAAGLPRPGIYPTGAGGVNLEWDVAEVTIHSNGLVEFTDVQ